MYITCCHLQELSDLPKQERLPMEDAVEGQQLTSDQELQAECLMESMALSHLLQPILEGVSQCKMSRRVPCVNSVLAHQKLVLYISSC